MGYGILLLAVLMLPLHAQAIEVEAPYAYMVDVETGSVLLDKNGHEPMPPASMSKLMTAFMVFERLQDGRLSLDEPFLVSENAWRKGGAASGSSTMFLEPGSRVRVEDLLRGMIVQSGNDACIVVAENLATSEEAFARMMTERGAEIGLEASVFKNATGWPDEGHVMTAHDLAVLATTLIRRFPEFYSLYGERSFTHNGITQSNRNPLLDSFPGADGLKTGHTSASGYGLTASAARDGRRLVLVVNGLDSGRDRARTSEALLRWGFSDFTNVRFFRDGETVTDAEVWLGDAATVPLVTEETVFVTLPRRAYADMTVTVRYEGPIAAPIAKGQALATLHIEGPGMEPLSYPLVAAADVPMLGPLGRASAALQHVLFGAAPEG